MDKKTIKYICRVTRRDIKPLLKWKCKTCKTTDDLQIHHIRYTIPVKKRDCKVLCRKCHVLEHQKDCKRIVPQEVFEVVGLYKDISYGAHGTFSNNQKITYII